MSRNTSITLGHHFSDFIKSKIVSGRFANASEAVRAGLRLLEEEAKVEALDQVLDDGEASGFIENFDPEKNLAELKKRHRTLYEQTSISSICESKSGYQ